jgi:AraC-like DNA-binding protein
MVTLPRCDEPHPTASHGSSVVVPVESPVPSNAFIESVILAIGESMRDGEPNLKSTARLVGLGRRTLQRRLALHGTTHRELLETARRRLAPVLLAMPESTVTQVAGALGYNGRKALCRAFRRWTGASPRELVPRSTASRVAAHAQTRTLSLAAAASAKNPV